MPDVPHHAWTHRPRSQGGTDPLSIEVPGGIVSHFARHPLVCSNADGGFTKYPGGVCVVAATQYSVAGTPTTDATENYSSQTFLRYTTANTSYAAASNLIVIDPAEIDLIDGHSYAIYYTYRLAATTTGGRVTWETAADTPAEVSHVLPASSPANDWYSIGLMGTTVGLGVVRHGTPINIRAWKTSGTFQLDIDQIYFVPRDYQTDSPAFLTDPGVHDTYSKVPDIGQLSSTTTIEFPDLTHWNGQCISDTQTVNSVLDPAFRWSSTGWSQIQQMPQSSNEHEGFAWEMAHGRHMYASARLDGGTEDEGTFETAGMVSIGSNGMPHDTAYLFNNSWQLVYLGQHSPSLEQMHVAGWVVNADPGGNEAPFEADGADIEKVRVGVILEVTCLYDPQGV